MADYSGGISIQHHRKRGGVPVFALQGYGSSHECNGHGGMAKKADFFFKKTWFQTCDLTQPQAQKWVKILINPKKMVTLPAVP
jgi:hypothetical protein